MKRSTRCIDCRVDTLPTDGRGTEYYSVHADVWAQTGLTTCGGLLCIGCLERRIGRRLNRDDFIDAEVNVPHPTRRQRRRYTWTDRTPRLQDRLTRQATSRDRLPVQATLF